MKTNYAIPLAAILGCLAGCASAPKITLQQAIGPDPKAVADLRNEGALEVYSAREQLELDVHLEVYFAGASFMKEKRCLPAHTDYTIYTVDGQVLKRVRNAKHWQDSHPARITLSPGRYVVEADSQGSDGILSTISVPVVIEAKKATVVYLEGDWRPRGQYSKAEVVRLPNGQRAGWLAGGPGGR